MFASKDALIANASSSGYSVNNSLRFRSSASAYLSRTFAAGNRKTFTWSGWVKRGAMPTSAMMGLFEGYIDTNNAFRIDFSSDQILAGNTVAGVSTVITTAAVYRDPSSWYHVVLAVDTTQATAANRTIIYVNGVAQTVTGSYVSQNTDVLANYAIAHYIGNDATAAGRTFDGYMAEVNFIDGQALTPSSFGAYDATTGVWQPARYTGSYGTNGFYLKFASFGTAAALGTDSSGNSNTWTVNNFSVTSGTTYDPMLDVPTLTSATVANYPTLTPLGGSTPSVAVVLSNANLTAVFNRSTNNSWVPATMTVPSSGKWYWEWIQTTGTTTGNPWAFNGVLNVTSNRSTQDPSAWRMYIGTNGNKSSNAGGVAYGSAGALNDIFGVAVDMDNGKIFFSKNNVWQGSGDPVAGTNAAYTDLVSSGITWVPGFYFAGDLTGTVNINFGQRPFAYTPPTGFVALNAYNLSTPTIANGATVMAATTYTGTGAVQSISDGANTTTNVTFQPDLVWIKSRSAATNNNLFDSLRTATNYLISNSTAANATNANTLTAFNTGGFALGSDASSIGVNISTNTYVAWQWLAGAGSSSSNTNGSITSTVSVNATAGFSVVTFTGNGTNPGATIGHGLGVTPSMIITKSRSTTGEWPSYHSALSITNTLYLNATYASSTYLNRFSAVSSTTFTTGSNGSELNTNGTTYVAYCWSAVAGYSAFGSYTGNGSADGPFVYTGFRPRWIMIKRTDASGSDWRILDTSRNTYNVESAELYPSLANAETTYASLDGLSNGFKIRNSDAAYNASSGTYIYAAFAENPFKYALAR
jgi:hypothetical protein